LVKVVKAMVLAKAVVVELVVGVHPLLVVVVVGFLNRHLYTHGLMQKVRFFLTDTLSPALSSLS
jgi:hypothetical protein